MWCKAFTYGKCTGTLTGTPILSLLYPVPCLLCDGPLPGWRPVPETPTASSARVYVESARASGPGGSMDGTNVSLQCSLSAPQDVLTETRSRLPTAAARDGLVAHELPGSPYGAGLSASVSCWQRDVAQGERTSYCCRRRLPACYLA